MKEEISYQVDQLLEKGIITESDSAYNNSIVMVLKKNTSVRRMCIDFRVLNSKSHPVAYPLPKIDEIFDHLKNAFVVSSIDLESGFLQIMLGELRSHRKCSKRFISYCIFCGRKGSIPIRQNAVRITKWASDISIADG